MCFRAFDRFFGPNTDLTFVETTKARSRLESFKTIYSHRNTLKSDRGADHARAYLGPCIRVSGKVPVIKLGERLRCGIYLTQARLTLSPSPYRSFGRPSRKGDLHGRWERSGRRRAVPSGKGSKRFPLSSSFRRRTLMGFPTPSSPELGLGCSNLASFDLNYGSSFQRPTRRQRETWGKERERGRGRGK